MKNIGNNLTVGERKKGSIKLPRGLQTGIKSDESRNYRFHHITKLPRYILLVIHELLGSSNILEPTIVYSLACSRSTHPHCCLLKRMLPLRVHEGMNTTHLAHGKLPLIGQKISSRKAR